MVRIPRDVRTFLNRLKRRFRLQQVYLFGSRAKGTPREDSDWDFIIISTSFGRLDLYHRAVDGIIKKLEKHAQTLRGFGVKHIELFGSYARGEQRRGSDIDFLVTYEKERGTYNDMLDVLHFLEDIFHKKIDAVKPHLIRKELRDSILGGDRIAARI